ncbi:MAG TPA: hypothetical protein PLC42_01325 [Parachlamydiaceae bacterium]|nr:hypothetical protein [Parachlamydiaceae bacterium]
MQARKITLHRIILIFLFFTGCGYQLETGSIASRYSSIAVPYAEGDFDGSFTKELIRQIATSGIFQYQRQGSDLLLKVRLMDFDDDNIGYRYFRNKKDKLTDETIPVETRLFLTAEISLLDASSGLIIQGPYRLQATTDFDHDYYSTKDAINVFSLGQLTDYDEALDAAQKPLHYHLAKKIVDFLADSW